MDRITNPSAVGPRTTLAFHVSRIVVDAGVLLAMAAMSMSFVTGDAGGRDSVVSDALPVILLIAPVFLATLVPDHSRPLPAYLAWPSLVLTGAALPYAILKYLDAANVAATVGGSVGFGARLLIFGTFVTLVGVALGLAGSMLRVAPPGAGPQREPRPAPRRTAPPGRTAAADPAADRRAAGARTAQPNRRADPGGGHARTQRQAAPARRQPPPRSGTPQPRRTSPPPRRPPASGDGGGA